MDKAFHENVTHLGANCIIFTPVYMGIVLNGKCPGGRVLAYR